MPKFTKKFLRSIRRNGDSYYIPNTYVGTIHTWELDGTLEEILPLFHQWDHLSNIHFTNGGDYDDSWIEAYADRPCTEQEIEAYEILLKEEIAPHAPKTN